VDTDEGGIKISFLLPGYILAQDRADDKNNAIILLSVKKMIPTLSINRIHFRGFSGEMRIRR